jgi:putative transposase
LRIFGVGVVKTTTKEDPEMKKGRFTPEQIIGVLKQHEAGRKVQELARELGVSEATIYTWKSKYGGMDVSEAQRLKQNGHVESFNGRLRDECLNAVQAMEQRIQLHSDGAAG